MLLDDSSTIALEEVAKFAKQAQAWWDVDGCFSVLHRMNALRMQFIIESCPKQSLLGKKVLDVGCGGGIASLCLARAGGEVTAIDPAHENIAVAIARLQQAPGLQVNYQCLSIESLPPAKYDVIVCLEVVEHVDNLPHFLQQLTQRLAVDGTLIISTINRTLISYLAAIYAAEYILGWVPRGTHSWRKFVTPKQLCSLLPALKLDKISGMQVHPLTKKWRFSASCNTNYIASFRRCYNDN